jgi:predicted TPR repeat methyltransferase
MTSLGPGHFQHIYDANKDPWNYRNSDYEKAKREATIEVLHGRRFRSGLEVGCSIGELTNRLADYCDQLLGLDFIDAALAAARKRCKGQAWVSFQNVHVPAAWPDGRFDLIVLSEVLYFLSFEDNARLAALCRGCLESNGIILLVNWLERSPDDPCSGDTAAARFIDACRDWLRVRVQRRTQRYRLDMLEARAGRNCLPR